MADFLSSVTSKGQITIPQPIREALGLNPGDRVRFTLGEDGVIAIHRVMTLDEIAGSVPALSPPKTWKEIQAIVAAERADAYAKKHLRKTSKSA